MNFARILTPALALLFCTSRSHAQSVSDVLEHARPAVVTILTSDAKGKSSGLGSGFVVRQDGVIVTAWHVVSDAAAAKIKMQDGKEYAVKGVLAKDAARDFALLKVDAENLPVLPLGDSDHVRQGDRILTLGSPQGLEETASEGMVSAVRMVDKTRHLQITAPISHGNSGGPVLNMQGEAVGIAVFYLKDSQSLNFAVAIDEVKPALEGTSTTVALPAFVSPEDAKLKQLAYDKLLALGSALFYSDTDRACRLLDEATVKRPNWAEAWYEAGRAYAQNRDYGRAITRFKRAIAISPNNSARAYMELGDAYEHVAKCVERAVEAFKSSARFAPDHDFAFRAYDRLATAEARCSNFKGAIHAFKALIQIDHKDEAAYFGVGFAYDRLGRHQDAEDALEKGRKLIKNQAEAWTKLGDAWAKSDEDGFGFGDVRWQRAADAYKQAIATAAAHNSAVPESAYYSLAEANENLNQWPEAVASYCAALKVSPDHNGSGYYYRYKLGEARLKADDIVGAKADYAALKSTKSALASDAQDISDESEQLLDEINQYSVCHGKTKVAGVLKAVVSLSRTRAAATDAVKVLVDGTALNGRATNDQDIRNLDKYQEEVELTFGGLDPISIGMDAAVKVMKEGLQSGEPLNLLSVNLRRLSDGPHTVQVLYVNKGGGVIAQAGIDVIVDNTSHAPDIMRGFTVNLTAK